MLPVELVIVVPCYNEAARLPVAELGGFAARHPRYRFLLVNDGSTDDTAALLHALRREAPQSFLVHELTRNRGKAEAVRQGVLRALEQAPAYVAFWDADLATPLEALPEMLAYLQRAPQVELLLGSRVRLLGRQIQRHALRHYVGRVFATGASLVLRLPVYDTQCGAKLFRVTPRLPELLGQPFCSRWVFDVELLARLRNLLAQEDAPVEQAVHEYPLLAWRDVQGSKVRPRDALRAALDLWRIARRYNRTTPAPRLPTSPPLVPSNSTPAAGPAGPHEAG